MEELANLINNVARFLAFGIGGVSVIVFLYAGFLFMTASGDPQKSSQARMAIFGAFMGLIVAGAAFVLPRIISQAIIEPAGGVAIVTEGQISCDELLKQQLVAQRGANNASRMQEVVRLIQTREECSPEVWNLEIHPGPTGVVTASVGGVDVPIGLRENNQLGSAVRKYSYRDGNNNILVIFRSGATQRPADGAKVWLYVSRLRQWYTNFAL